MPDAIDPMPWLSAWTAIGRELMTRAPAAASPAAFAALQPLLVESYRKTFMPGLASPAPRTDAPASGGQAARRFQAAVQGIGVQVSAIAADAFRRLNESIAAEGATAPPITSLRQLFELWIECGEAAYAEAAHGEAFASAQVELLTAFAELRAQQRPGGR